MKTFNTMVVVDFTKEFCTDKVRKLMKFELCLVLLKN